MTSPTREILLALREEIGKAAETYFVQGVGFVAAIPSKVALECVDRQLQKLKEEKPERCAHGFESPWVCVPPSYHEKPTPYIPQPCLIDDANGRCWEPQPCRIHGAEPPAEEKPAERVKDAAFPILCRRCCEALWEDLLKSLRIERSEGRKKK
jgi:hypothetical protein